MTHVGKLVGKFEKLIVEQQPVGEACDDYLTRKKVEATIRYGVEHCCKHCLNNPNFTLDCIAEIFGRRQAEIYCTVSLYRDVPGHVGTFTEDEMLVHWLVREVCLKNYPWITRNFEGRNFDVQNFE